MSKIEKRGNIRIINDEYIEKQEKDLKKIYDYLLSRDFNAFVPLINRENDTSRYSYIEDLSIDDNQKGEDLIKTISSLHNKTSFNKEVTGDTYKNIYKKLIGYVNYLEEYYAKLIQDIEYHDFPSPSETIILENYYKVIELFNFLKKEINNWFFLVKDKTKQRVCLNHGKLELSHMIKNDKNYLISMDEATFSSPVNDLIRFYKKEWDKIEFSSLLESYLKSAPLNDDELKLFIINITTPDKFEFQDNEFKNTIEARKLFDYIFKTERLIMPYYSKQEKE